jgi:outer membrane protein OmpA-like peptidoglycan-associated protein
MFRILPVLIVCTAVLSFTTGCNWSRTAQGGAVGAGAGAAVGAAVGHATGSTVRGAIIGAAVGGTAGALIGRRMDQQAEELRFALPDAEISRIGEGIAVTFPSGLLFPFDSDQLHPAARDNLTRLAESLREYGDTRVLIVGHTDSVGSAQYNQGLSERRSRSAADFLVGQGIARSRLETVGAGQNEPIATNETADGRQLNRRVEVAIFAAN